MEKLSEEALRQACRCLWKEVFHDADPFLDLYFSRRFTPENTYTIQEDGYLMSAMQSLSYRVLYRGRELRAGYVSGLATRADLRGRGLGTSLLSSVHRDLYCRGRHLSLLIPATERLFDYYKRLGYVVCSYRNVKELDACGAMSDGVRFVTAKRMTQRQIVFFNLWQKQRSSVVLHGRSDLKDIVSVAAMSGGGVVVVETDAGILALGICEMQNGECHLIDAFGEDQAKERLAEILTERMHKVGREVCVHSYNSRKGQSYGMVRVIKLHSLLNIYAAAHREADLRFRVVDDAVIPSNNGLYILHNGRCRHFLPESRLGGAEREVENEFPVKTFAEISSLLFEDEPLQMSLMLD